MEIYLASSDPMKHVLPADLFKIGGVWVTNHMVMATLAGVLMLLIFPLVFRRGGDDVPRGARSFFESILDFLRSEVFRPALKENTDRFVPFLWTVFFFILFCNLLGLIPFGPALGLLGLAGGQSTAAKLAEYTGTATGNLNTTGTLAVCAFVFIHLNGMVQVAKALMSGTYGHHGHEAHGEGHGHGKGMNVAGAMVLALPLYLWNFAPHPFRPQKGEPKGMWAADVPVWGMLLLLEMIGALVKPFALMIRLFANMIAGHMVLAAMVALIVASPGLAAQIGKGVPVVVLALLISLLELFVSFLQAYIFTFLTTLFIASAVAPEH